MLDPGQPLLQRLSHLAPRRTDGTAFFVLGHRVSAGLPRLAFGPVPAPVRLAAFAGQRIRVDVEQVRPVLAALVDVPLHAAWSSVSMNSRSLADTTYTRRPRRLVGRSPALAKR